MDVVRRLLQSGLVWEARRSLETDLRLPFAPASPWALFSAGSSRRSTSNEPLLLENEREAVADLLQYLESQSLLVASSGGKKSRVLEPTFADGPPVLLACSPFCPAVPAYLPTLLPTCLSSVSTLLPSSPFVVSPSFSTLCAINHLSPTSVLPDISRDGSDLNASSLHPPPTFPPPGFRPSAHSFGLASFTYPLCSRLFRPNDNELLHRLPSRGSHDALLLGQRRPAAISCARVRRDHGEGGQGGW